MPDQVRRAGITCEAALIAARRAGGRAILTWSAPPYWTSGSNAVAVPCRSSTPRWVRLSSPQIAPSTNPMFVERDDLCERGRIELVIDERGRRPDCREDHCAGRGRIGSGLLGWAGGLAIGTRQARCKPADQLIEGMLAIGAGLGPRRSVPSAGSLATSATPLLPDPMSSWCRR